MLDILVQRKLINVCSQGFLKARSYLTNFFRYLEEMTKCDGSPEDVIYLEVEEASDEEPRQRVLRTLKCCG